MNNVGGPGCTKLEILLFILQRFKPRESILHVTNMILRVRTFSLLLKSCNGITIRLGYLEAVFRIHRIYMFLALPNPDPLVRSMDPDPDPERSIIKQK
jgi:hypothetical protein